MFMLIIITVELREVRIVRPSAHAGTVANIIPSSKNLNYLVLAYYLTAVYIFPHNNIISTIILLGNLLLAINRQ